MCIKQADKNQGMSVCIGNNVLGEYRPLEPLIPPCKKSCERPRDVEDLMVHVGVTLFGRQSLLELAIQTLT